MYTESSSVSVAYNCSITNRLPGGREAQGLGEKEEGIKKYKLAVTK